MVLIKQIIDNKITISDKNISNGTYVEIIPLNISKDVSEIDGDWSEMTEKGLLN